MATDGEIQKACGAAHHNKNDGGDCRCRSIGRLLASDSRRLRELVHEQRRTIDGLNHRIRQHRDWGRRL